MRMQNEGQKTKMPDFQNEKNLVRAYYDALDNAPENAVHEVLARFTSTSFRWRGFYPFNELNGIEDVTNTFWVPLISALSRRQRRQDIFFAGRNEIDGFKGVWVVSMGHIMGLFDAPWLGIKPTGKMTFLRYCEFNRVEGDQIVETAMYFDIPHLMTQAGQNPFPPQTAAHLVQPGPQTHDGLLFDQQDPDEGEKTLATINAMISDLGKWDHALPLEQELALTWQDDMIWWGPAGIGASYTIERYAKQHSGPFRAAFSNRTRTGHVARLAEGYYGGFFGWPNFTATLSGDFMGMSATGKTAEFRVIDIYRRGPEKLAENWIFIDLLHFWNQQGIDFLGRATGAESK
jgi:predicted ester cyclase